MYRKKLNKGRSARAFRGKSERTKYLNIAPPPMRGGFRL